MNGTLRSDGSRWTARALYHEADDAIRTRLMRAGTSPALDSLGGWEFNGVNTAWFAAPVRKFRKGFFEGPARAPSPNRGPWLQGFNIPVIQDGPDEPHRARPSESHPLRHGFYRVYAAAELGAAAPYPDSLILDYGVGGNRRLDPQGLLRDYLVQLYPDDPDLLLGHAFGAVPVVDRYVRGAREGTVSLGFFILTRARPHGYHGAESISTRG